MSISDHGRDEKPGLISGRRILLFSLVFLVGATFLATWVTLRWVESEVAEIPPLQWSERDDWNALRVQWVELAPPPGPRPPFESKYRRIEIDGATPEQLAAVATIAAAPTDPDVIDAAVAKHPDLFYGWFARGLLHQQAGEADAAEAAFAKAMRTAPAALVIPLKADGDGPAAGMTMPEIVIAAGQKTDGELDDSVTLVYRNVTADAEGKLYLPVFDVPAEVTAIEGPDGRVVVTPWLGWFTFPGQTGRLPAAEVRNR